MTPKKPVEEWRQAEARAFIAHMGGVRACARKLNLSAASVCVWQKTGVPSVRRQLLMLLYRRFPGWNRTTRARA